RGRHARRDVRHRSRVAARARRAARPERAPDTPAAPAFLYVGARLADALLRAGTARGSVAFTDRPAAAPARNVVALLRGTDPALRGQMVAVGAHNDHIGMAPAAEDHDSLRAWNRVMRPHGADDTPGVPSAEQLASIRAGLDSLRATSRPRPDSVFNGADDDGSGSVGVLEIAEALARSPARPRRSILFVWHTGEELGLLGSDWFTRHPTVPRDSIVAQLNIDMIGRGRADDLPHGGPDYLQLIGTRRLSTELGDLVERVNTGGRHGFAFNYEWDADGHPSNTYCRSDHYMYARFGIPIAFFTTGSHRDYHQLTDEARYIDYEKMAKVTSLVADVTRQVADLDHRIVVDKPKPDPEAPCKQ
ncbi:MAG TPA: M28 family peptidase, partial [Gemmatimonadales bacterium]|nr:M28 family peptidase [Gemmatimonadales bacterium]